MKNILKNNLADLFFIPVLLFFAFFLCMSAGERGLFAYDQSIVFDGGYRVLSGQLPYKDFIAPYGPVVFLIQGLFFRLFGVSYLSYVVTAAVLNVVAVAAVMFLIRLFFPSKKYLSYLSGLLTAVWFYSPSGTPYIEQTAFLFVLLSVIFICAAYILRESSSFAKFVLLAFSGLSVTLSLLSKQNAGIFAVPLYFLLIFAFSWPRIVNVLRDAGYFVAGILLSAAAFYSWLITKSDINMFNKYFIFIPSLTGIVRFSTEKINFLTGNCSGPLLHNLPFGIRLIMGSSFIIMLAISSYNIYRHKKTGANYSRNHIASLLAIYLFFYQYLFIHSSMNQAENGIPFVGIIFISSLAIFPEIKFNSRIPKLIAVSLVSFAVFYLSLAGVKVSLTRTVQEFSGSQFSAFPDKGLRGLKWGESTVIKGVDIKKEDVARIYEYLRTEGQNFFVLSNFTVFYGLTSRRSPQPLLWFHKGLTYSPVYDVVLDRWIVESLKKSEVKSIIIEEVSIWSASGILNDFPLLKSYVNGNFRFKSKIGIFNIMEIKHGKGFISYD